MHLNDAAPVSNTAQVQDLEHATDLGPPSRALFQSGRCRCDRCAYKASEYGRTRKRAIMYQQWSPFVDAGPVRQWVKMLLRKGVSMSSIAQTAGVPLHSVENLMRTGPKPLTRIRRGTADALQALDYAGSVSLRRRTSTADAAHLLRSLVSRGWTFAALSRRCDLTVQQLSDIAHERIGYSTRPDRIREVHRLGESIGGAEPVPGIDGTTAHIARARGMFSAEGDSE